MAKKSLNQHLSEALASYSMKRHNDKIARLNRRYNEIKQVLEKHYGDKIYSPFKNGSLAKGTEVNLKFDLDMVIPYKKGNFAKLQSMFDDLYQVLQAADLEGEYNIRQQTVSIGIKYTYAGKSLSMDIVPGMEIRTNDYSKTGDLNLFIKHPEKWNGKDHVKSNPKKMIQIIKGSPNDVHNIIRLIKAWKYHRNIRARSFLLELMVVKAFKQHKNVKGHWAQLKMCLAFIRDNIKTSKLKDPGNTGNIVSDSMTNQQKTELSNRIKNLLNKLAEDERDGFANRIKDYFPIK